MKPLTQEQAIVRYLAARPGQWIAEHYLGDKDLDGHWVSPRGYRTARDLAQAGKYVDTDAKIGPKGMTYFIERTVLPAVRQDGRKVNYAHFRVAFTQEKKPKFVYVQRDGVTVEIPFDQLPVSATVA